MCERCCCLTNSPARFSRWYLRFNGYLTIESFVIHDFNSSIILSDVDLIGVRFGNRDENGIEDDKRLISNCYIDLILAEIKRSRCELNGPWDPNRGNIERALKAIGLLNDKEMVECISSIKNKYSYNNSKICIRILAFGALKNKYLSCQQILFSDMAKFIYNRLSKYSHIKRPIGSSIWGHDGRLLIDAALSGDYNHFLDIVCEQFNLRRCFMS